MRLILFLAGLFFITLYSCTDLSKNSTHEFSRTTPVSLSDSLLMVEKFELLLQAPNKTDSLLASASFLLEEKPELNDIYNSSYGRFLILTGQIDQARDHVNAVIQSYDTDTLHLNLAKYHNLMAAIAAYSKNHEKSVFHFKRAIMLNELHGDHRQASVIKFNLANIFFERLDYDSAYLYADEALPALEKAKDTTNLILCLSVLAAAEINLERPKEAEQHARRALRLSEHHNNLQAQLSANYAMGEIELASGSYEAAINRLEAAIILGEQQHMLQWLLPIRAALQKTYLVNENHLEAVQVGEKLMEQATFFGNRDVMYSTLKNLALAQEKLSLYQEAFNNMKEAESLLRENMSETTERVLRETLVKYETEKKNNIILQQENKISQQQIRTIWLVAFSAILILSLVMIWNHTRQKNRFLIKDKENAVFLAINEGEERERKRLAGELHDGIASNLVAIKLNLENHQTINKETDKILELLEKTHQEIRLVAHNLAPLSFDNQTLAMALQTFSAACSHPGLPITFRTDRNVEKRFFPKNLALILYRSVQEVTQNAMKHAHASKIDIQLSVQENEIQITVADNGIGFDPSILAAQNYTGLKNLKSRLSKIGGILDIDSQPNFGTTVFMNIDLNKMT